MEEEIRAIITEYMPLDDDPENALAEKSVAAQSALTVPARGEAESSTSALLEARDAP